MEPTCPRCHTTVRATDFFCFNCGANLRPEKPPISTEAQITLYLKSLFLPPMGIIWGLRYLRQEDQKSKIIGWVAIGITMVVLYLVVAYTVKAMNTINNALNSQLNGLGGL